MSNVFYKQSMCTVPNCSRKYSELLHTDTADADNVVHDDVMQVNDSIQVCNIATKGECTSVYLPIVGPTGHCEWYQPSSTVCPRFR